MDHLIDGSKLQRLARVKRLPRKDDGHGASQADEPRQTLGPAEPGNDTELNLGKTEPGLLEIAGNSKITSQGQLGAAAKAIAVNCRGRDSLHGGQLAENRLSPAGLPGGLLPIRNRPDLGDIGPRDKGPAAFLAADDHQSPNTLIRGHLIEDPVQLLDDRLAELVYLMPGQIEYEKGDPIFGGLDGPGGCIGTFFPAGHSMASTTTAPPCPPPTQRVASPRPSPRRRRSLSRASTMRAPLAPTG